MPWGWAPRQETRAQSHAEPSSTTPWKEQEAQVLKRLIASNEGRFRTSDLPRGEARLVYLQKQVQAGVREEAEADLVHGFRAWLQGTHDENRLGRTDKYLNKPDGRPHRRKMDGTKYTDERTDWQSTPWGDAQLTHLPGVREWLREEAIAADKADLEMQLLAEYGPHDVESAWRYYKHWVLKRPISYPHAHADQWDENWHGPGLHSAANTNGWMPRRSTHFDALPEPPSKRPPGGGAGVGGTPASAGFSTPASSIVSPPYRAYAEEQPAPDEQLAAPEFGLFSPTPRGRSSAPDEQLAYVAPPEFGLFSPSAPDGLAYSSPDGLAYTDEFGIFSPARPPSTPAEDEKEWRTRLRRRLY